MKKVIWGLALLVVACTSSNSPEGIKKETLGLMNDMTSALAGIKDEASAKAAVPKLQEIATKMEDIKKRAEPIEQKMTPEQKEKFKNDPEMKAAAEKLMKEAFRIATVPGAAEAMKAMQPKKG